MRYSQPAPGRVAEPRAFLRSATRLTCRSPRCLDLQGRTLTVTASGRRRAQVPKRALVEGFLIQLRFDSCEWRHYVNALPVQILRGLHQRFPNWPRFLDEPQPRFR